MARSSHLPNSSQFIPLIGFILLIAALYFAKAVLVPFALAALLSFLLTPIVRLLEQWRLGRIASVIIVSTVSLSAVAGIGWIVSNQLLDVINRLPTYKDNIRRKIESIHGPKGGSLSKATDTVQELSEELSGSTRAPATVPARVRPAKGPKDVHSTPAPIRPLPVEVVEHRPGELESLRNMLGPVLAPLETVAIVIVFTVFMLMKREDLRNRLIRLAGQGKLNVMTQAMDDAGRRVSRYLLMQFVVNATFGSVIAIGLYFIGVPNAILWGVLAGLLRFVPYIGPLIGGALPLFLALAVFNGWMRPMLTFVLFAVTELTVANVVEPWLYGAHTGISSLAILVVAVFWTVLWGPVGLILSTPLTVCLLVLGRYVPHLEFLNILLGDEPVLTPDAQFYQRLLAGDQQEAQSVVDTFLAERPLIELYDTVIIPALTMAEQDRHKGDLEEAKENFLIQSTKEFIEVLAEYEDSVTATATGDGEPVNEVRQPSISTPSGIRVLCLPASDRADEIAGAMLAQILEKAGYPVLSFSVSDNPADIMKTVSPEMGDIVCISALPPFAMLSARTLSKRLRSQFPMLKIIVGLWNFSDGGNRAAERLGKAFADTVVTTLAGAVEQIGRSTDPCVNVVAKVSKQALGQLTKAQ